MTAARSIALNNDKQYILIQPNHIMEAVFAAQSNSRQTRFFARIINVIVETPILVYRNFRSLTSDDIITDYVHKSPYHHQFFCKTCGIYAFYKLNKPETGDEILSVNIACLDDLQPGELAEFKVCGWEEQ